jgi:hypothetical protein
MSGHELRRRRRYASPEAAREARRQQTRIWHATHRVETAAAYRRRYARVYDFDPAGRPAPVPPAPAKHVVVSTHVPGTIAYALLGGRR